MKKTVLASLVATALLAGCGVNDADVVSENLSTAADNFEIVRHIVFVNGVTDKYLLEIVGRCSVDDDGNQLEVTCKTGDNAYKKHFLGLSDNVTYFSEQVNSANVSDNMYRVVYKPSALIPDAEIR